MYSNELPLPKSQISFQQNFLRLTFTGFISVPKQFWIVVYIENFVCLQLVNAKIGRLIQNNRNQTIYKSQLQITTWQKHVMKQQTLTLYILNENQVLRFHNTDAKTQILKVSMDTRSHPPTP